MSFGAAVVIKRFFTLKTSSAIDFSKRPSPCWSLRAPSKLHDWHHSDLHSSRAAAVPDKLKSEEKKQEENWVSTPWRHILDQLDQGCVDVDDVILAFLLRKSGDAKALAEGKKVHEHIVGCGLLRDRFLGNLLIQMYGKCGAVEEASQVFKNLHQRNVFSWALIIGACVQNGYSKEAIEFYIQMEVGGVKPDKVTCIHILSACANQAALPEGKRLHASITRNEIKSDVALCNALVNMYGKCGCLDVALRIFETMHERDVVSWNTLLAAYAQHGQTKKAFELFQRMLLENIIPNKYTYVSVLDAFGGDHVFVECKRMHTRILSVGFESDVIVGTSLVNIYGKMGNLFDAWMMFARIDERNVVSWSVMIAAFAQQGHNDEAYQLFQRMQWEGVRPNKVTYLSILDACVNQAALAEGKRMHSYIASNEFELHVAVAAALVNMYSKCGSLDDAGRIFHNMPQRDVVLWSSMIAAAAQHGQENQALQLFQQMQCEGVTPNRVTFDTILSACSHAGLADECCYYLASMTQDHDIRPSVEHYNCLLDLLGRVGRLDEGENLIKNMPVPPTTMSWMTLLAACKMHLDVERGKRAARTVAALDPGDATPYVLLSNIFAAVGRWDDATSLKQIMQDEDMKRHLDYLCIMDEDDVHISSPSLESVMHNVQICT